jgi:hypothetical protein
MDKEYAETSSYKIIYHMCKHASYKCGNTEGDMGCAFQQGTVKVDFRRNRVEE